MQKYVLYSYLSIYSKKSNARTNILLKVLNDESQLHLKVKYFSIEVKFSLIVSEVVYNLRLYCGFLCIFFIFITKGIESKWIRLLNIIVNTLLWMFYIFLHIVYIVSSNLTNA